jgi:hypothetical protein
VPAKVGRVKDFIVSPGEIFRRWPLSSGSAQRDGDSLGAGGIFNKKFLSLNAEEIKSDSVKESDILVSRGL